MGRIDTTIGGESEEQAFVAGEIIENARQEIWRFCRSSQIFEAKTADVRKAPRSFFISGQKNQGFDGDFLGSRAGRRRGRRGRCSVRGCGQAGLRLRFLQPNFPFVNFSLLPLTAIVGLAGCGWSAAPQWAGWFDIMQKSVLIVEDNELNMKLFNDLLEAHGYQTVQTRSGVEAVELARTHRPNLILMDIQLPEVSGLQVTQWIKDDEDLRHIPVIAITAFAMKGDEEKIRQGGCEAYLSKPISVVKFLETVRNYIADS